MSSVSSLLLSSEEASPYREAKFILAISSGCTPSPSAIRAERAGPGPPPLALPDRDGLLLMFASYEFNAAETAPQVSEV